MLDFVGTRSRTADPDTSRAAANHAASRRSENVRYWIRRGLESKGPMTAKQIAEWAGFDYYTTQRRISETAGIERTDARHDGCVVWRAVGSCYFSDAGEADRNAA